ncbi:hypothetical protein OH77DRAFT_1409674 [Trametes cingulata]|nr:hypothetical protein OH77DRAFT_1409674 [Trametes cingulata]
MSAPTPAQAPTPLTGPLGPCCTRPGAGAVPHAGVARGTVESIAGLQTYVARPSAPSETEGKGQEEGDGEGKGEAGLRVILYFADVFGPMYLNGQLAMDYWAAHGYLVLGPDYFEGDSAAHHRGEPGWDVDEWVVPFRTSAARITPPWVEAVRDMYGLMLRGTGYCFGAPFVMDLLAEDWVTAGAFAHPAFLDEGHFMRIKSTPLCSYVSEAGSTTEDDFTFPHAARRRAEDILVSRKAAYFIQIFGGAFHGFATRPDPSLKAERWAKEESAGAVLRWFAHHAENEREDK